METGLNILKLSFYLSLVVLGSCAQTLQPWNPSLGMRPRTCDQYECPTYKLVEAGNGYEIRMYDFAVWMSTDTISDPSMTQATKTGFLRLFRYIQGDNKSKVKMSMTAPVITQATPGKSVYTVSFYLPKKNQQNPPQADDLHVQPWKPTYVAVRQFGGYVSDDAAKKEAAALMVSLQGTKWIAPIEKSKGKSPAYMVADYNPPFQITARVNEIMVPFNILFVYIQGENKSKVKMNMTAPVIIQATPGKLVYTVSFYLQKQNQQNPPLADDLHVQPWKPTYIAVRQFGGYASDDAAKKEAAALMVSLQGTKWIAPIEKSKGKSPAYLVADYNPSYQIIDRVNEIMVPFNM